MSSTFKKGDRLVYTSRLSGYNCTLGKVYIAECDEQDGILQGKDNNYIQFRDDSDKLCTAHVTRFKKEEA